MIDKQKLLEWAKKEFYAALERKDEGAMLAYQNLKYAVDTNEIEIHSTVAKSEGSESK